MNIARYFCCLLAGLSAQLADVRADLVEGTDPRFGLGSLTLDTRTGLAWLDLPLSLNLSYQNAESAMQPGGMFYGYRHATLDEVRGLYQSAGIALGYSPPASLSFQGAESSLALIGATEFRSAQFGGTYPTAYAIAGPVLAGPSVPVPYISYGWPSDGIWGYYAAAEDGPGLLSHGLNTSAPTVGNWIVAIPEPSEFWLAIVGGTLLIAFRKIRRKRKA